MPSLSLLPLIAPLVLLLTASVALVWPRRRPGVFPRVSEMAALVALCCAVLGLPAAFAAAPVEIALSGGPLALALRFDPISATVTLLVAFIGWIVMRYARTYLDGEERESAFHGLMLATLAAVLIFIQSDSLPVLVLSSIGVGLGLRRLLLFYPERAAARRAATKFSLVWHAGDAALLLATSLLFAAFGTVRLDALAAEAGAGLPVVAHLAVALLVLTAALKTAALPLHGWLTEVMEAPTPVSALLHAGIVNSGGFLLIRTADLVQASSGAMAALVMVGGLTALFGAVVMLTQSAVKTALAWSTVSQMGFMLLQCGLGLWPLALLHLMAHSMYKAHAFLSSGGAVAAVAGLRKAGPIAVPSVANVARSFALSVVLFAAVAGASMLIVGPKSPQALALGAMLIFGVAYLVAQGLADAAPAQLMRRTGLASFAAALAYFAFQQVAHLLWGLVLPAAPAAGPLEWALIALAVLSFGAVALAQALFPLWAHHPAAAGLRVHVANGFYLNALLDRLIGGFRVAKLN